MTSSNTHATPDMAPRRGSGVRDGVNSLLSGVGPAVPRPETATGPTARTGPTAPCGHPRSRLVAVTPDPATNRPDDAVAASATQQAGDAPRPRSAEEVADATIRAAVEFVVTCRSAQLLLDEHKPDKYNRCQVCTDRGVHNVRYPCVVAFIAQQALPLTKKSRLR